MKWLYASLLDADFKNRKIIKSYGNTHLQLDEDSIRNTEAVQRGDYKKRYYISLKNLSFIYPLTLMRLSTKFI